MARLLEDLEVGTPVYLADSQVGEVRGVYAEGGARLAEYLAVYWGARGAEVLIPTKDVQSLEPKGVILMGEDPRAFASHPAFDVANYPTIRRIH
jgi:hypothetical protein